MDKQFKQAKSQLEQYGKDQKVPAGTVKIVALSTNEELLLLKTI